MRYRIHITFRLSIQIILTRRAVYHLRVMAVPYTLVHELCGLGSARVSTQRLSWQWSSYMPHHRLPYVRRKQLRLELVVSVGHLRRHHWVDCIQLFKDFVLELGWIPPRGPGLMLLLSMRGSILRLRWDQVQHVWVVIATVGLEARANLATLSTSL